ncbi:MAG TPA: excinuclease ABC subunit UvrC [Steroidobacteraceae bacterium]|nr:excinuclease ABC subunit UvrC [Steroidobacteraceae bacterium]
MSEFDAKDFVRRLPERPGVYRMLDAEGRIIYVGKARSLRSRVGSYFRADQLQPKVQALVRVIADIEVTVTNSDTEALLLEHNLIKSHRPRFNVILRDDKSFPYVHLSAHEFPRLSFYRGSRKLPGRLFGPYPSASAVHETLNQLHKLFRLRSCKDTFFANRTRPCLEYQIGRCTAPCTGLIDAATYARDVESAAMVLDGRARDVTVRLGADMDRAAERLDFERAALLRDQLAALTDVQARQVVTRARAGTDTDVIAVAEQGGAFCVALMFVRGGQVLGTSTFFPRAPISDQPEVLSAFLAQHYLERDAPPRIYVSHAVEDAETLAVSFTARSGRRVRIAIARRGYPQRWVALALQNAANALQMREATQAGLAEQFEELRLFLGLDGPLSRIECFDVSHTQGEATNASCVVFTPEGPLKSDYRRYNIEGVERGDDYGALRQALSRRYRRRKQESLALPDLLLVDGGKGQLEQALAVLKELELSIAAVAAVAKGADRRVGQERVFLAGRDGTSILPPDSKALHLIQRARDEAHRFAISGHRRKRARSRQTSMLEAIAGLGPARRRALLRHFGGLQGVLRAGVEDLGRTPGIGPALAQAIYEHLHPGAG